MWLKSILCMLHPHTIQTQQSLLPQHVSHMSWVINVLRHHNSYASITCSTSLSVRLRHNTNVVICRFLTPPASNNYLRNVSCNKVEKIAMLPFPALHFYHWYFLFSFCSIAGNQSAPLLLSEFPIQAVPAARLLQTPASILVAIQPKNRNVVQLKFHEVVQVNCQYSDKFNVHDITVEVL